MPSVHLEVAKDSAAEVFLALWSKHRLAVIKHTIFHDHVDTGDHLVMDITLGRSVEQLKRTKCA